MKTIIEGYLIQRKLEKALMEIVGNNNWKGREINIPGTRKRWDMAISINEQTIIVEFDGDQHYRDSLKIKTDIEKDQIANSLGYKIVRIPYWVQLTSSTFEHYFGFHTDIIQKFSHGFITTKIFPASYCELGIKRFEKELNDLPIDVKNKVVASLMDRIFEHGKEYVLPKSLFTLI